MYKITALMDNYTDHKHCLAEHGLSYLIETPDHKLLFDTGASGHFFDNAKHLKIDLSNIDYLVLSHGHYDHTGGLKTLLENVSPLEIIAHPDIFLERYSKHQDRPINISIPFSQKELEDLGAKFTLTNKPYKFNKNVFTTGEVEHNHDSHAIFNMFKKEGDKLIQDYILDDLSIIIVHDEKINIICGCSHASILNIIEKAISLTGIEEINYVIGGLHFFKIEDTIVNEVLYELNYFKIKNLAVSHCTGVNSIPKILDNVASNVFYFGTGDTISIQ